MQPYFDNDTQRQFLYKYLDQAQVYFEFGSGGSTYQANIRDNIKVMHSVESDPQWYDKVLDNCPNKSKFRFHYVDVKCRPNTLGLPGPDCPISYAREYPKVIDQMDDESVDLVFVDGRFRVSCALHAFRKLKADGLLVVDDYCPRTEYFRIEKYYEMIDKCQNRIAVFRKRDVKPSGHDIMMSEFCAI